MQLEDDLLERLANAPDDILSDVPLIEGLEATKVRATDRSICFCTHGSKHPHVTQRASNEMFVPIGGLTTCPTLYIGCRTAVRDTAMYRHNRFRFPDLVYLGSQCVRETTITYFTSPDSALFPLSTIG